MPYFATNILFTYDVVRNLYIVRMANVGVNRLFQTRYIEPQIFKLLAHEPKHKSSDPDLVCQAWLGSPDPEIKIEMAVGKIVSLMDNQTYSNSKPLQIN